MKKTKEFAYYRHNLDYRYPDQPDEHMIEVKHLRDVNVDKDYPYLQKSFWFKCQRVFLWIVLRVLMFWLIRITHGLRIYGRENLKKHKEVLKDGTITISNHICMWDFICVMKAVRPRLMYFPAWKTNLEGPNGPLIRMAGGIPIPTDSFSAMKQFKAAMEDGATVEQLEAIAAEKAEKSKQANEEQARKNEEEAAKKKKAEEDAKREAEEKAQSESNSDDDDSSGYVDF